MMTRKILLFILTVILALGLAACGSGGKKVTPEPAAPAAAVNTADTPAADEPAAAAPTKSPAPTARPTSAPTDAPAAATDETLNLADRAAGLKDLKSYRLTWTSEWTPDDATEKPVQMKWTQEYVADPPAQYIAWSGINTNAVAGATADEMVTQMWRIGPTTYMLMSANGESQCMAITQDEQDSDPPFDPSLLGSVENAKYVGRETVNGLSTKHYVYDTVGFALLGADKVSGDAWVAEDGNYMVKEVMTWDGGAGLFAGLAQDEAKKGKGSWTWELSDINKQFTIEPPEECLNAAGDAGLPIPPGAQTSMQTAQMSQYTIKMPVADLVKFYQKEMPAAGWSVSGDPTVMGEMAILAFAKDDKTANIMVTGDDSGGSVVIVTME